MMQMMNLQHYGTAVNFRKINVKNANSSEIDQHYSWKKSLVTQFVLLKNKHSSKVDVVM